MAPRRCRCRMINDFFAEQRRQRIGSRIVIACVFVLLWSIANAFLIFTHVGTVCSSNGFCHSGWQLNIKVLALTALVVGAYLAVAPLIARHSAVNCAAVRVADGPDGALLRNVA